MKEEDFGPSPFFNLILFMRIRILTSFFLLIFILASCDFHAQKSKSQGIRFGKVEFLDTVHDFGIIPIGSPIDTFDFKFVNISEQLLVILDVKTSCHCTKAEYSLQPILPGDTSFIRVIYDGTGRKPEYFKKTVTVYTSATNNLIHLHINGYLQ